MASLRQGMRIQVRVIYALMIREMSTRFGRENVGFLWIMLEPLMFAVLVGFMWRFIRGSQDHGIGIFAFVATGYIPLVMFRHSVSRSVGLFSANGSLMYHRQIKIYDFVFARFIIENIGHMMAYLLIAAVMMLVGVFPWPHDFGFLLLGWLYYSIFTLATCFVLAPLSEVSEVTEKLMPVTTYMMVPFSGAFNLVSWMAPSAQQVLLWSPPVHAMEMMRYGVFGDEVLPQYSFFYPLAVSVVIMLIGLAMCRRIRRHLVVE